MTPYLLLMGILSFQIPIILAFPYLKQYSQLCDWREQPEPCDQSRGLACSYITSTCSCWDARKIFSPKVHRCVGKAGEECAYSESERLCTENAYCLEDRSLSPIPLCVCLKGYFRTDSGTCIKYSKLNEPCEQFPNRQACEPETGLKCFGFTCQCEKDHIYDPVKELCIAKAGQKCSRTLNNCVENAECNEKTWELDHASGETKQTGFRCGCNPGLKITEDGLCAADYGGSCNKTQDCYLGENLTCLNGICQCHPLSQIYDKRARRCFNLVGARCHLAQDLNKNSRNLPKKPSEVPNANVSKPLTNPSSSASSVADIPELSSGTEGAECISNSECVSSSDSQGECRCVNGSSETVMKTCLLDYGQLCQSQSQPLASSLSSRTFLSLPGIEKEFREMKCNVFEGLVCHSDLGKCLCADPSLKYDEEMKTCVSTLGNLCGYVKLDMLDLNDEFKKMVFINCDSNSTCLEKNVGGKLKRVCVPVQLSHRGSISGSAGGNVSGGSSLSKIMFSNANVIKDTE